MRTVAVTDIFNYTERLKFVRGKGSDGREHGVQRIESIQSFGFSTINNYCVLLAVGYLGLTIMIIIFRNTQ